MNIVEGNPYLPPPEYTTDEFNTRAVERFSRMEGPWVERAFEEARQDLTGRVGNPLEISSRTNE